MAKPKIQALKTMGPPETVESIIEMFRKVAEPRVTRTRRYRLDEILFLVLAAMISGVNHLTQIQLFGEAKLEWFRKFLPFEHGIPSHDTIGRVLGQLDPDAFEIVFMKWMQSAAANIDRVVAVDGKTLRRAIRRGEDRSFVCDGPG